MSNCPAFRVYLGDKAADLMPLLRGEMHRKGATISGSDTAGTFHISTPVGAIAAKYELSGKSVLVTVTSKPMVVSCGQIQDKLTDGVLDAKATLKSCG